jgi:hypothetical protein
MYSFILQELVRQTVDERVRAADAHRTARAAAPGVPRPGAWRPWLGYRLVAMGERIAGTTH